MCQVPVQATPGEEHVAVVLDPAEFVLGALPRPLPVGSVLVVPPMSRTFGCEPISPDEVLAAAGVANYKQCITYLNAILLVLGDECLQTTVYASHLRNTPPRNRDIDALWRTTKRF